MNQVVTIDKKELVQLKQLMNDVYNFFRFLGVRDVYIHIHFQKTDCPNIFAQSFIGGEFDAEVTKDRIVVQHGIIRLTDNFFKLKRVERVSVLIHEIIHLAEKPYAIQTSWKYSIMVDHIRAELLASVFEYLWLRVYNKLDEKYVEKFLEGVYQELYNSYFRGFVSYERFKEWFMRAVKKLVILVIKNSNIVFAFTEVEKETIKLLKILKVPSYDETGYHY